LCCEWNKTINFLTKFYQFIEIVKNSWFDIFLYKAIRSYSNLSKKDFNHFNPREIELSINILTLRGNSEKITLYYFSYQKNIHI